LDRGLFGEHIKNPRREGRVLGDVIGKEFFIYVTTSISKKIPNSTANVRKEAKEIFNKALNCSLQQNFYFGSRAKKK